MLKRKYQEEREVCACLLTTVLLQDISLVEETFPPEIRKKAKDLWNKLEEEGFITPKEKINRLMDMLLTYSSEVEVDTSALPPSFSLEVFTPNEGR